MVAFLQKHGAPFDASDFAEYYARIEEPAKTTYRGYTVYKHGFGSQGPVLLQALNILENFDLQKMGHASADYLHTVTEAMKLAYADRDTYYADPAFVQVPGEGLLSKDYAKERAALIDPKKASTTFIAGDPLKFDSKVKQWTFWKANETGAATPRTAGPADDSSGIVKDTTHMAVIDKDGNIFDVTPSGGWVPGAVILGDTGIGMSVRGEQFWLDKTRANQIRPRARPRYTLTPSMVFKGDVPMMGLGTPGGDNQDQTILQALLSVVDFWDDWYPEPALRVRAPARADDALLRIVLAARGGLQSTERGSDHSRRRVQRAESPRPRRQPPAPVRHVRVCDGGDDRSGDRQPLRRRRSPSRLLRDRVLSLQPCSSAFEV